MLWGCLRIRRPRTQQNQAVVIQSSKINFAGEPNQAGGLKSPQSVTLNIKFRKSMTEVQALHPASQRAACVIGVQSSINLKSNWSCKTNSSHHVSLLGQLRLLYPVFIDTNCFTYTQKVNLPPNHPSLASYDSSQGDVLFFCFILFCLVFSANKRCLLS